MVRLEERYNQTLQKMLSKAVMGHKEIWDQLIDSAYNTLSQESTNYTPFEVKFGRKARIYLLVQTCMESICELISFLPELYFFIYIVLNTFLVRQRYQTQPTTWNMCPYKDKGF